MTIVNYVFAFCSVAFLLMSISDFREGSWKMGMVGLFVAIIDGLAALPGVGVG